MKLQVDCVSLSLSLCVAVAVVVVVVCVCGAVWGDTLKNPRVYIQNVPVQHVHIDAHGVEGEGCHRQFGLPTLPT